MIRHFLVLLLCGTAFSGCAVHQVHKDHDLIRTTLLDLYTNQILDNLVRAANGMPIIQLDYTNATAQVTVSNGVTAGESQTRTTNNLLTIPAATLAATRSIVTTPVGGYNGANSNQVAISATPVTTINEVYDAYLEYLSLPDSLIVSCDPPPPGAAHLCKPYDGKYFWVPIARRSDFFRLSLLTTAQRGKTLLAPDDFYAVKVLRIKERWAPTPGKGRKPVSTIAVVKLDKKIPNDSGHLKFVDKDGTDVDGILYIITPFKKRAQYTLTPESFTTLESTLPLEIINALRPLENKTFPTGEDLEEQVFTYLTQKQADKYKYVILRAAATKDVEVSESEFATVTIPNELKPDKDDAGAAAIPAETGLERFQKNLATVGSARIYLDHRQPTMPTTQDLLNKVNFQLQQIQFNQLRTSTNP